MDINNFLSALPYGAFERAKKAGVKIHSHPKEQIKAAFKKLNWLIDLANANGIKIYFMSMETQKEYSFTPIAETPPPNCCDVALWDMDSNTLTFGYYEHGEYYDITGSFPLEDIYTHWATVWEYL